MRMVSGGLGGTSGFRSPTHKSTATGFAKANISVFNISNLADGSGALNADPSQFARRQANQSVISFFNHQTCSTASASDQLTAFSFEHFNIMDSGSARYT